MKYLETFKGDWDIINLAIVEKFRVSFPLELYSPNEESKFDPNICCKKNW